MMRYFVLALCLLSAPAAYGQSGLVPQNSVFAGPTAGGQGFLRARALVAADLPTVPPGSLALASGQILVGQVSGFAAAVAASGDCTIVASGAITCTKTNGVAFAALATTAPGTGVATALGVAVGSAGAIVVNGGALGTPSSGVGTNLTALNANNLASGTVAAARGGAGAITGALKGNGAGVVSQAATTDLSDTTTSGTVTPSDASGAGLTFSGVSAKYDKIGDIAFVFVQLSYPVTANGSTSSINLTGAPAFPASSYGRQCTLNYSITATAVAFVLATASSNTIVFASPTGAGLTNANMSSATIVFQCTYPVT